MNELKTKHTGARTNARKTEEYVSMFPAVGPAFARVARLTIALLLLASALVALAPAAGAVDGVNLNVHLQECPAGFDGMNATMYNFAESCHSPIGGVNFTAQFGNVAPSSQTDLDGRWSLTDLPAGNITLTEFPPPGQTWLMRAFCSVSNSDGSSGGYVEAPLAQGGATWNLTANQTLNCQWYNFFAVQQIPVSIDIALHGCPEGFDGINANIYDFALYCHTPIGGSNITVEYGNLAPTQQTDLDGRWSFTDIPAGTVTLHQFPVEQGLAIRAFCKQADGNTGQGTYYEAPVGQGSASWNLLSGQYLTCEWYNFPFVDQTVAGVSVRLHECPDGYRGSSATIYELAADCQGTPQGVNFAITPLNSTPQTEQTDQIGWVDWENIPSGKMTIKQQVPSDVTYQRVFCNQRKITGEKLGLTEIAAAPDGTLTDFLLAGYDLYDCDWYNISDFSAADGTPEADDSPDTDVTPIPTGDDDDDETGNGGNGGNGSNGTVNEGSDDDDIVGEGTTGGGNGQQPTPESNGESTGATSLTITLFTCAVGYDLFAEDADPAADCQDIEADVEFTSLGDRSGITASKITDENGQAIYPKLGSGHHLITAWIPWDIDYAFILGCSSNLSSYDSPLYPVAFAGPNGEISIDVQKGEQLACDWYNVPA